MEANITQKKQTALTCNQKIKLSNKFRLVSSSSRDLTERLSARIKDIKQDIVGLLETIDATYYKKIKNVQRRKTLKKKKKTTPFVK